MRNLAMATASISKVGNFSSSFGMWQAPLGPRTSTAHRACCRPNLTPGVPARTQAILEKKKDEGGRTNKGQRPGAPPPRPPRGQLEEPKIAQAHWKGPIPPQAPPCRLP